MSTTSRLTLVCVGLALVLFPLTFGKPGFPLELWADEPANYLAALSLAHDRDLACDPHDLQRLFREFPIGTDRLHLTGPEAGARFAVPLAYPLLTAPIAATLGSNGMLAFNLLLLVVMVVLGAVRLGGANDDHLATLFAGGFMLLSPLLAYAFRLEGVVLAAALVVIALVLGLPDARRRDPVTPTAGDSDIDAADAPAVTWTRILGSAFALAIAATIEPLVALLGVAIIARGYRDRGIAFAATWLLVFALTTGLFGVAAYQLTGCAAPAAFDDRTAYAAISPTMPLPEAVELAAGTGGAPLPRVARDLIYMFVGRHVGIAPQLPFALLALAFYRRRDRHAGRRTERRLLVVAFMVAIVGLIVLRPGNWDGGPEGISNPHLVVLYPALVFVVGAVSSPALLIAGFAVSGLTLGPLILTSLGQPVPAVHSRAYTRGLPYRPLPVERTLLDRLPGMTRIAIPGGHTLIVRTDHIEFDAEHPDEIWLLAATDIDLWLVGEPPPADLWLTVRNILPNNRARLRLDGADEEIAFGGAEALAPRRVLLRATEPADRSGLPRPVRRLQIRADKGAWPRWQDLGVSRFYLGLAITVLGATTDLERDVYGVAWGSVQVPQAIPVGADRTVRVELTNRSSETWSTTGSTRVKVAYHWLAEDGSVAEQEGLRSELPGPVAPGAMTTVQVTLRAPVEAGNYTLVLDPIRENVGWFSDRGVEPLSIPVTVTGDGP